LLDITPGFKRIGLNIIKALSEKSGTLILQYLPLKNILMLANTDLNNEVFEIIGSLSAEDGVPEQLL